MVSLTWGVPADTRPAPGTLEVTLFVGPQKMTRFDLYPYTPMPPAMVGRMLYHLVAGSSTTPPDVAVVSNERPYDPSHMTFADQPSGRPFFALFVDSGVDPDH